MSFNIVTVREENGEALMNVGAKYPPCSRCGHTNHIMGKYFAKKHADGTMLHNLGEIEEVEHEINNEVSTEMTTKNGDLCCHDNALMFVQPDINWPSNGSIEHIVQDNLDTQHVNSARQSIDSYCVLQR